MQLHLTCPVQSAEASDYKKCNFTPNKDWILSHNSTRKKSLKGQKEQEQWLKQDKNCSSNTQTHTAGAQDRQTVCVCVLYEITTTGGVSTENTKCQQICVFVLS